MVLELELEVALQLLVHMNQVLLVELEVAPEVALDVGSRTPIHGHSTMFA